jgi:sec-independent protein translocase protein TatC
MSVEHQIPFMAHLFELRRRLTIAASSWIVAFIVCYYFSESLFLFISKPLRDALPQGSKLVFLSPVEPFFTYMKIAAVAGVLVALPVILWQIWGFISPGLYKKEKRFALPFVASAYCSFIAGAYFGFTWIFPLIFSVLMTMGLAGGEVTAMISMGEYFSIAWKLLLAFGAIFETPIVILIFARMGVVDAQWLSQKRKYFVIVAFIIAGIATPGPDVFSQTALAVPFVLLYEVGIILARLFGKKMTERIAVDDDDDEIT